MDDEQFAAGAVWNGGGDWPKVRVGYVAVEHNSVAGESGKGMAEEPGDELVAVRFVGGGGFGDHELLVEGGYDKCGCMLEPQGPNVRAVQFEINNSSERLSQALPVAITYGSLSALCCERAGYLV